MNYARRESSLDGKVVVWWIGWYWWWSRWNGDTLSVEQSQLYLHCKQCAEVRLHQWAAHLQMTICWLGIINYTVSQKRTNFETV